MHYILGLLATVAALAYWFNRASRGANEIADAANTLQNLPRKMRYRKKAGKRGLDLVEDPVEAAAVLMIALARSDGSGRVSETQSAKITSLLRKNMQLDRGTAEDMVLQMRSLSQYLTQPESTLFPMISVLQNSISTAEARELAGMLRELAGTDSDINMDQKDLIRRFEDRMGLLG